MQNVYITVTYITLYMELLLCRAALGSVLLLYSYAGSAVSADIAFQRNGAFYAIFYLTRIRSLMLFVLVYAVSHKNYPFKACRPVHQVM